MAKVSSIAKNNKRKKWPKKAKLKELSLELKLATLDRR